jgi:hypothetical protein|tara:strand:+ start:208 stop:429 length:222 start_codon:yes stop_codon:yes gene_type:complete
MSYFNEPARLAMLNIQRNLDKEIDEKPSENKGLLSRTNPMAMRSSSGSKTEIDKVIEYARNVRMEMRKQKNGI